jgi:hypothetical protein
MSKKFCTLPTEKHANPKHSQIKDYSLFALMMAFLILFVFYFFGVDISEINDDFYQSLTLSIIIFFIIIFCENR